MRLSLFLLRFSSQSLLWSPRDLFMSLQKCKKPVFSSVVQHLNSTHLNRGVESSVACPCALSVFSHRKTEALTPLMEDQNYK